MSPKLPVPAVLGKDELGWGLATGSLSMSKAYPHFKPSYPHDELVEHFLLTPADLQFVLAFRGDANRLGVALLLKVLPYLGYVPRRDSAKSPQRYGRLSPANSVYSGTVPTTTLGTAVPAIII
jgi:Domain of unknown function (DUF4158)